jgi:hypothetical protein
MHPDLVKLVKKTKYISGKLNSYIYDSKREHYIVEKLYANLLKDRRRRNSKRKTIGGRKEKRCGGGSKSRKAYHNKSPAYSLVMFLMILLNMQVVSSTIELEAIMHQYGQTSIIQTSSNTTDPVNRKGSRQRRSKSAITRTSRVSIPRPVPPFPLKYFSDPYQSTLIQMIPLQMLPSEYHDWNEIKRIVNYINQKYIELGSEFSKSTVAIKMEKRCQDIFKDEDVKQIYESRFYDDNVLPNGEVRALEYDVEEELADLKTNYDLCSQSLPLPTLIFDEHTGVLSLEISRKQNYDILHSELKTLLDELHKVKGEETNTHLESEIQKLMYIYNDIHPILHAFHNEETRNLILKARHTALEIELFYSTFLHIENKSINPSELKKIEQDLEKTRFSTILSLEQAQAAKASTAATASWVLSPFTGIFKGTLNEAGEILVTGADNIARPINTLFYGISGSIAICLFTLWGIRNFLSGGGGAKNSAMEKQMMQIIKEQREKMEAMQAQIQQMQQQPAPHDLQQQQQLNQIQLLQQLQQPLILMMQQQQRQIDQMARLGHGTPQLLDDR